MPTSLQKWSAEFLGTFWLTFGGCGSAVLAAAFPQLGIGFLGVSLAFGLTVLTGAYALGPISGGHFNPAVSVGLALGGRFKVSELPGYVVAQVLGAIVAAGVLYLIATGKPGADIGGFATNGYGEHSPGGYGLMAAVVAEVVLTAVFLIVILGVTSRHAAEGVGGMGIVDPFIALWVPFLLFAALILWMYHIIAHVPGGQPIGAREVFATKSGKWVKRLFRFGRKSRLATIGMPAPSAET